MSKENSQKITEKINAVSQELKELALSLHKMCIRDRIIGDAIPHYFHPFVCLGVCYAGLTRGRELLGAFSGAGCQPAPLLRPAKEFRFFSLYTSGNLKIKC